MNKALVKYVQPTLVECLSTTCTSKKAHDVFVMVVNFFFNNLEPKHITIGLFHAKDTNGLVMFVKLKQVLDKFLFTQNIVICVIGKGSNLQTCVITFNLIVSCDGPSMAKPFDGSYFGHALSKVCQYDPTLDGNAACELHYVSI